MSNEITVDVARKELQRFANAMDLDWELEYLSEKERQEFDKQERVLIKAMQKGKLLINDNGEPEYTTTNQELDPLVFREPKGTDLMSMDKGKENEQVGKMYRMIASICGVSPRVISSLPHRDQKVITGLTVLFFG